jgi:hypothetical protein
MMNFLVLYIFSDPVNNRVLWLSKQDGLISCYIPRLYFFGLKPSINDLFQPPA